MNPWPVPNLDLDAMTMVFRAQRVPHIVFFSIISTHGAKRSISSSDETLLLRGPSWVPCPAVS